VAQSYIWQSLWVKAPRSASWDEWKKPEWTVEHSPSAIVLGPGLMSTYRVRVRKPENAQNTKHLNKSPSLGTWILKSFYITYKFHLKKTQHYIRYLNNFTLHTYKFHLKLKITDFYSMDHFHTIGHRVSHPLSVKMSTQHFFCCRNWILSGVLLFRDLRQYGKPKFFFSKAEKKLFFQFQTFFFASSTRQLYQPINRGGSSNLMQIWTSWNYHSDEKESFPFFAGKTRGFGKKLRLLCLLREKT
jgi:hypothetical protein